jgi:squalene-hopene/tetraprenyl-beta-curcumene cyclase
VHLQELFAAPDAGSGHGSRHLADQPPGFLAGAFLLLDRIGRWIDPLIPRALRERAIRRAENWVLERLNGEDGLGAIFPAMVNALEVMTIRGFANDDPRRVAAKRSLEKLLVVGASSAYCQPCVSPVWDTALAGLALQAAGGEAALVACGRALEWLRPRQLIDEPGDWQVRRPGLRGGGWAFQFANSYYPDLDDTAVVAWAMHQARDAGRYQAGVAAALDWLVGMQSRDGGFAAFDADNTCYYLNALPFADHGALIDPPTSDVTARVVTALALVGRPQDREALGRALAYLRNEQEADGSWFGRWGTNYIYGTWSVLTAFAQAGIGPEDESVRRAVRWLKARQHVDGGWGEGNDSYAHELAAAPAESTPYQSAWALLALLAVGEADSAAVRGGVAYLLRTQQADGLWSHPSFTAPGFPRVFHLKYHGYSAYFPLWALALYRNLSRHGTAQ